MTETQKKNEVAESDRLNAKLSQMRTTKEQYLALKEDEKKYGMQGKKGRKK